MKNEIWDVRHSFKNEFNRIIVKENARTETMEELEEVVLQRVKQWIERENPRSLNVDGIWQKYVK